MPAPPALPLTPAPFVLVLSPNAAPYTALVTSEHNEKPNYMAMLGLVLGAFADTLAVVNSIPSYYDLDTAVGSQLDAIGLWVGQSRVIGTVLTLGFFGFPDDPAALTMGELHNSSFNAAYAGVFYEIGGTYETNTSVLGDTDYRTLLRLRVVRNQSNGLIGDIEEGLNYVFGAPCQVQDTGAKILNIIVPVPVSSVTEALVKQLDILPRPAGIAIGTVTFPSS